MKLHQGQTILEILITTTLVSMLLVSLLALNNYSLRTSTTSKKTLLAAKYSQQAADWLHSQKTTLGWTVFLNYLQEDAINNSVTYCLNELPNSLEFRTLTNSTCTPNSYITGTNFYREVSFDLSSQASGTIKATITTSWQEKTTLHSSLTLTLTKWEN